MSTTKTSYNTSTAVTITLTSLANGSARESTAVVNTTTLYLDAQLYVACKLAAGTPSGGIDVYLYGSEDGTNYDDNATGSDAAITLRTPCNLVLVGRIQTETSGALTWKMTFKSLAASFGGVLPRKWGVCIANNTGLAFDSTGNSVTFTGIYAQTV